MQFLARNMDWLKERLEIYIRSNAYVLFDLPGQVMLIRCLHSMRCWALHHANKGLGPCNLHSLHSCD